MSAPRQIVSGHLLPITALYVETRSEDASVFRDREAMDDAHTTQGWEQIMGFALESGARADFRGRSSHDGINAR